jgi:prepilin-type processing-associated H-X9-DG protein
MIIWLRKAVLCGRFGAPAAGALGGLAISLAVSIWMLAALVGATHGAAAAASPCVSRAFDGASYIVCTFDLREYALRLFWKDENGVPYGGFDHLPRRIGAAPMVFAMNAGMYDESLAPVGLYIESGKVLKRANTASGTGNFHLKPNGIFYVDGANAGVLTTEQFLSRKPKAQFATQSGPMLVIDGRIHPKIRASSTSRKIRNGVGLRDPHTVVFAISDTPVTFWSFARLFRDGLGTANALFLDGSISSLCAPVLARCDTLFPMGAIVAAYKR